MINVKSELLKPIKKIKFIQFRYFIITVKKCNKKPYIFKFVLFDTHILSI